MEEQFSIGDKVKKVSGDYVLEGVVVAVFFTLAGRLRYVVEHTPAAPGLLHIYAHSNLMKVG